MVLSGGRQKVTCNLFYFGQTRLLSIRETELWLQLHCAMALPAPEAHQDAGGNASGNARQSIHPTPTSISEMIKPVSAPRCNTATVIGHCYRINASWFRINISICAAALGAPQLCFFPLTSFHQCNPHRGDIPRCHNCKYLRQVG